MSTRLAIQECYRKLERQHEMLRGAQAMRQSTDNPAYQQTIDVTIREAQRNIGYLEEKLQSLELKEKRVGGTADSADSESSSAAPPPVPEHGAGDYGSRQGNSRHRVARKEAPPPPPKDNSAAVVRSVTVTSETRRHNLSKLGKLRIDTRDT